MGKLICFTQSTDWNINLIQKHPHRHTLKLISKQIFGQPRVSSSWHIKLMMAQAKHEWTVFPEPVWVGVVSFKKDLWLREMQLLSEQLPGKEEGEWIKTPFFLFIPPSSATEFHGPTQPKASELWSLSDAVGGVERGQCPGTQSGQTKEENSWGRGKWRLLSTETPEPFCK